MLEKQIKNKVKGRIKKVATIIGTKIGLIILIMLIPILIVTSIFKVFTSKEFTKQITESLLDGEDNIEKIISDVHIKDGKWYLSTEDELTERLTKCIEDTLDSTSRSVKFGDDLEYLKQFLYAEIATSRPSLDGDGQVDESVEVTQVESLDSFLFVGDSYTVGLKSTIEKNCKNSVVKAVKGVSASYWLDHFNEMPNSNNIKGVCLLIGVNGMDTTNDSYRNSQTDSTKDLIKKLSEKYSNVPVYVQKVFPVGKNYKEQNPEKTNKCIKEHNDKIKSYCSQIGNANYIDTTEGFVGSDGYLTGTSDGLHINDNNKFYKNISSRIKGSVVSTETKTATSVESLDNFLFVGDSITVVLKDNIEKNCKNAVIKAKGGQRSSYWITHFNEMPDAKNIKGVCLLMGINGLTVSENREKELKDKKTLINKLSEKYANVPIYVEGVLPVAKGYQNYWTTGSRKTKYSDAIDSDEKIIKGISEHNESIKSYCNQISNAQYIDVTNGLIDDNGYLTSKQDYIHVYGNDAAKLYNNIANQVKGKETGEVREAVEQTSTDLKGVVKIKRRLADKKYEDASESIISLKYVPEDTLRSETNWDIAKTYFSMNEDYSCVLVASKNIDESTGGFTIESIPYLEIVKPFTMHVEFLLTLNETLENPGFCLALADLVKSSEIHLTILDSQTTTTTKSYIDGKYESGGDYHYDIQGESTTTTANYITSAITYADIWIMRQTKEPTYQYESTSDTTTTKLDDKVVKDGKKTVNRVKTVETTTETISWNEGTSTDNVDKVDDIIKMIKTRYAQPETGVPKAAEGGIKSAPGLILDILDSLPRAENEAQIMRYIIYKLTGRDFGVTELDFSMFEFVGVAGPSYWWPIGGEKIDERGIAAGPPTITKITSKFGYRQTNIPGASTYHKGIDIANHVQAGVHNVIAMCAGTVEQSGFHSAMGYYVLIDHGNGLKTRYQHMHPGTVTVKVGQKVEQGQVLGKVGESGVHSAPHLHFSVLLNGEAVDPENYVSASNPRPVAALNGNTGTDEKRTVGGKTVHYSAAFAAQTKTPEQLGLKYTTVTGSTTNYDACRVCCETTHPQFATGLKVEMGRKVVAKCSRGSYYEYGDWVYIPGWGYALVADCGGFNGAASNYYHLDCYVGIDGDIQDDGKGNYSALRRRCINWKSVYNRKPGYQKNIKIYVIKYKDIPKELLTASANVNNNQSGAGYKSTFTYGSRTFKNYLQTEYKHVPYWGAYMNTTGCGPTAVAIIASGYGKNETPETIVKKKIVTAPTSGIKLVAGLKKLGISSKYYDRSASLNSDITRIRNHLKQGKQVILDMDNTYYANSSGHFITLLAINNKDQAYLSNPASTNSAKSGWTNLSTILHRGLKYYILVN